jgi:TonB family protein
MLDQLVESRGNKQASRRSFSFIILFAVAIVSLLSFAYLWSLIVKANDSNVTDDLDVSSLVAPVQVADEPPPPPEKQPEKKQEDDLPTRKENIARMDETPPEPPKDISVQKSNAKARPDGAFHIGKEDVGDAPPNSSGPQRVEGDAGPGGNGGIPPPVVSKDDDPPPKLDPPKPVIPKIVSKGVINGNAISLPKPAYPPTAKAVGASGAVSVQVTIDEAGNVISAVATSGHPLLKSVAAQAARGAKFRPTLLSGVAVKVSGIIVYNFQ